jgi:hypothetical protein
MSDTTCSVILGNIVGAGWSAGPGQQPCDIDVAHSDPRTWNGLNIVRSVSHSPGKRSDKRVRRIGGGTIIGSKNDSNRESARENCPHEQRFLLNEMVPLNRETQPLTVPLQNDFDPKVLTNAMRETCARLKNTAAHPDANL